MPNFVSIEFIYEDETQFIQSLYFYNAPFTDDGAVSLVFMGG